MQGRLSVTGLSHWPAQAQQLGRGCSHKDVHSIRRLAQRDGVSDAGKLLQLYVPQDGLAGGAHQRVAEGLAVGVVQILDGPAPRLSLVQEAVLPIVQPLKIQPGAKPRTHSRHREGTRGGVVRSARQHGRRRREVITKHCHEAA